MIKAKITIFDDETGRIYEKDRLIVPDKIEVSRFDDSSPFYIKNYIFHICETICTAEGESAHDSVPMQQEKVHTMPSDTQ